MTYYKDLWSNKTIWHSLKVRRLAAFTFITVLPIVCFYLVGARSVEPINGQDGYAYIGIVARTQDFLHRFPDSYFGYRFGYILPSKLFRSMFGFEYGHHLLRFALLAIIAQLMKLRGQVNYVAVITMISLFTISPIVLVSTFSTYTMSIGALTFLIGILLLASNEGDNFRSLIRTLSGAGTLTLAWNSHLQLLLPAIIVIGIITIDNTVHQKLNRGMYFIKHAIAGIAGALLVCVLASVFYGLNYGLWDLWTPALEFASQDTNSLFKSHGFEWITWRHYVLVIPVSVSLAIAVCVSEENPLIRRTLRQITLATLLVFCVSAFYQWVLNGITLETYFQSSALFILCIGLLAISAGCILNRYQRGLIWGTVFVGTSLATYAIGARFDGNFLGVSISTYLVLGIVFASIVRRRQTLGIVVALTIAISSWATVSSPHDFPPTVGGYRTDGLYDAALYSYDQSSLDRASVVDEISLLIPSYPKIQGKLSIWFNPLIPMDQLSAPFLWYRSSLQSPADLPLPSITPTVRRNLLSGATRYIAIIGKDDTEVSKASASIREIAPYVENWKKVISRPGFGAVVAFLQRED